MRRLILLRHAKSSWDRPELDDHDRPLAPRGIRAAPAMARWLAQQGFVPERVLCSDAERTRETWSLVAEAWDGLPTLPSMAVRADLYLASPRGILREVASEDDEVESLMVVGHNPGMHDLARTLARPGSTPEHRGLARKFPTAAAAVLDFDGDSWQDLELGSGTLVAFVRPKDLT